MHEQAYVCSFFKKYNGLRLTNEEQENFCEALWASPSTQIYLPPSPALGQSGTDSYALHFPGCSESAGFLLSLTEHGELEGTRKGKEKSAPSPPLPRVASSAAAAASLCLWLLLAWPTTVRSETT